jgi:hypothetical protein
MNRCKDANIHLVISKTMTTIITRKHKDIIIMQDPTYFLALATFKTNTHHYLLTFHSTQIINWASNP